MPTPISISYEAFLLLSSFILLYDEFMRYVDITRDLAPSERPPYVGFDCACAPLKMTRGGVLDRKSVV